VTHAHPEGCFTFLAHVQGILELMCTTEGDGGFPTGRKNEIKFIS
jgi:hypothetical protein